MDDLTDDLAALGLISFGSLAVDAASENLPSLAEGKLARSAQLIGNVGSAIWTPFRQSDEARDGTHNPLDRWTRRVLDDVANRHQRRALYPFGGPPWWPFISWAERLGVFSPSPLGVLVHEEYGPWLAFRAVLLSAEPLSQGNKPNLPASAGPCATCVDKPCLTACPVNAIKIDQPYAYDSCRTHVASSWPTREAPLDRASCSTGCLARKACPYGQSHQYAAEHAAHHMRAFANM